MNYYSPNNYIQPGTQQPNPAVNPYAQYLYNSMYAPKVTNPPSTITWVQGIDGAKSFQLSPNSQVVLLDSEVDGRMYIKTCNDIGMCELHYFNYVEVTESDLKQPEIPNQPDLSKYVTWEQLNALLSNLNGGEKSAESTIPKTQQLITTATPKQSK